MRYLPAEFGPYSVVVHTSVDWGHLKPVCSHIGGIGLVEAKGSKTPDKAGMVEVAQRIVFRLHHMGLGHSC